MIKLHRKKYSKEFKIQVVKQVIEEDKKISHIAKELELSRDMVYRWIKEFEIKKSIQPFSRNKTTKI
ncbi:transposase [Tepidibacter aestuarii]|uniref:transposase n=1 Tax=Tepidibacter aestuarii TaxID=2925782 RepID=UPI0020C11EB5|nr:transposase [Tepidibacter aestuarii]CAH2213823.1 transposase [Tepidibacter aestuarii]